MEKLYLALIIFCAAICLGKLVHILLVLESRIAFVSLATIKALSLTTKGKFFHCGGFKT